MPLQSCWGRKNYYRLACILSQNPILFFHPLAAFQLFIMKRKEATLSLVKHIVKLGTGGVGEKRDKRLPIC